MFSLFATFMVVKFGLNPKPISIIKASNFEEPEKLARYIFRQLYPKLKLVPILAFGDDISNPYSQKVVESLFQFLSQESKKPVSLYTDRDFLNYSTVPLSGVKYTKLDVINIEDLSKKINADGSEYLIILLFKNEDVIHNFKQSTVNQLEFSLSREILTFSFWSLENVKDTEELKPCEDPHEFIKWMDCLKENRARSIVITRKKVDPIKPIGILDRVSEKDFFIFLKNTK